MKIKRKKTLIYTILFILVIALLFLLLGYANSYIGYTGYNKGQYRRFSQTQVESENRGVFVKKLNFISLDSVKISNVFIEKGYKWGEYSEKQTILISVKDSSVEDSNLRYQIIFEYPEDQGDKLIYIPANNMALKDDYLPDTLVAEIYMRDLDHNLIMIDSIKIWE